MDISWDKMLASMLSSSLPAAKFLYGNNPAVYLDDMIDFAGKVIAYTDGLDQASFVSSGLNYDATVRNLEWVGEAATHIPEAVRAVSPQIPWRQVIARHNRLIHSYLGDR